MVVDVEQMKSGITLLPLDVIRLDGGTQPRAELNTEHIHDLTEVLLDGGVFKDPIIVFYDGSNYWLADGFHRVHASRQAGLTTIDAEVRQGTQEDAIEHSCGVNAFHGLKRKHGDIECAIKRLRKLPKWKNKTHQEIADHIHVSRRRVSQVLQESGGKISQTSVNQPVGPKEATNEGATVAPPFTNDDKRRIVIEQMTKDSTLSNKKIARICGVSNPFVSKIRKELFPKTVSKITRKTTPKSDPKVQPTPAMESQQADPPPVQEPLQVQPVPQETTQAPTPVKPSQKETPRNVDGIPVNIPHISSKSNEWYTPAIYIEAIRKVLGGIDLDPASCEEANQIVKAEKYYDLATNGLEKPWKGRVFLNPPYGRDEAGSNQEIWTGQLIDQYTKQNTSEAILLVNAAVDTNWFQRLFAYPVCLMRGRINFYSPSDSDSGATHGSAFVYFGPEEKQRKFVQIFNEFGTVVKRWS